MSTDRLLSAAGMALWRGDTPGWLPPVPWGPPKVKKVGSYNHRREAVGVALYAYLPPHPMARPALDQALRQLADERQAGHCTLGRTTELLTDSHATHCRRGNAVLLMGARQGMERARDAEEHRLYREAEHAVLAWWGAETYLCELHRVPRGPRQGQVVAVGARFDVGQRLERDECHSLLTGRGPRQGKRFYANAATHPDTWPCLLVRDLVAAGAFAGMAIAPPPTMPRTLTVERYEDGHVSRVDRPCQAGDPVVVAVRYSDGLASFDTRPLHGETFELGRQTEVVVRRPRVEAV